MSREFAGLICVTAVLAVPAAGAAQVVGWRGDGSGQFVDVRPPQTWNAEQNVFWSVDLPGRGYSSPVLSAERIFLTGVEDERLLRRSLGPEPLVEQETVAAESLDVALDRGVVGVELPGDLSVGGAAEDAPEEGAKQLGSFEPVGGGEGL